MQTMRKLFVGALSCVLAFSLFLSGCASQSGSTYSSKQTRSAHQVFTGTIVELNAAQIEDDPSIFGALGGAVVGGVAGSTIGGGSGRVLATLGGAIIGALAGTGIEKSMKTNDALEIVVDLDTGESLAVVQQLGAEEKNMGVGDKVRVIRGADGSARVRLSGSGR